MFASLSLLCYISNSRFNSFIHIVKSNLFILFSYSQQIRKLLPFASLYRICARYIRERRCAICISICVCVKIHFYELECICISFAFYWQNKANTQFAAIARNVEGKHLPTSISSIFLREKRYETVLNFNFSYSLADWMWAGAVCVCWRANRACGVCTFGRWLRVCIWWEMIEESNGNK